MRRLNHLINYDFDHDTFYKIENNGHHEKTYINGQPVKHFRPNVTGHNYLIRKSNDLGKTIDRMTTIKMDTMRTDRTLNDFYNHSLIDQSNSHSKLQKQIFKTRNSLNSTKHSSKMLTPKSPGLKIDVDQTELSRQKSNQKIKKDLLNKTLTDYSKMLRQTSKTNHSPKNNDLPGGQSPHDPLSTLCTTIGTFKLRQPQWQGQQQRKKAKTVLERKLQSNRSKYRKQSKQRQLYEQFHPVGGKEKQMKRDEVQKERKKNQKILQNLFIRQNNRITRKIYHSIV